MEISFGALVVIAVLASMAVGQWVIIWRLLNRLLIQAHIPSLGPVMTTPPKKASEIKDNLRRKVMSVRLDPFSDE